MSSLAWESSGKWKNKKLAKTDDREAIKNDWKEGRAERKRMKVGEAPIIIKLKQTFPERNWINKSSPKYSQVQWCQEESEVNRNQCSYQEYQSREEHQVVSIKKTRRRKILWRKQRLIG